MPVLASHFTDCFAWIAHCDHAIRNILGNYTSCADHHIASNRNTRQNRHMTADPNTVPYRNRQAIFQFPVAKLRIQRMSGCVKSAVRGNKDMTAKRYFRNIKNRQSMIGIKLITNLNIVSVIAPEGLFNMKMLSCFS